MCNYVNAFEWCEGHERLHYGVISNQTKTYKAFKSKTEAGGSLSFILCLFSSLGLYAGIKFFIIDFLFKSCPKLRDKYDTPYIVWNSLPTDPQLKERTNATVSRRVRWQKHVHIISPPALAGGCFAAVTYTVTVTQTI